MLKVSYGVTDPTIARIQTWACSLDLPVPLDFGGYSLRSRQYVAMRVTTSDGHISDTCAISRRLPVDVAIHDLFAARLLGCSALDVAARTREAVTEQRSIEPIGVAAYAWSLLDTALWDLRAQAFGVPLWRLLGGDPRPVPVLLVEGYELPEEDSTAFAERLGERHRAGYSAIKIEGAGAPDPQHTRERLAAVREATGDGLGLVVDLGWKYSTAAAAASDIRCWQDLSPLWVEDCLARGLTAQAARLRELVDVPLGAGDEVTRQSDMHELMSAAALDVVRLDAMTMGGVTGVIGIGRRASSLGLKTSPHMHPEIHLHCVLGVPGSTFVEAFPHDRWFDLEHRLLTRPFLDRAHDGLVAAPTEPGIGMHLDDAAVAAASYRHLESRQP